MMTLFIIAVGLLGCIVGSFLGVVVWRIGTGRGLGGRSKCLSCGHQLAWYELVPVVSFLAQKGSCRSCKTKIPMQDFWIEIVTGGLFTLVAWQIGIQPILVPWLIWVSIAVVISVYDIRHKMIHAPLLVWLALFGIIIAVIQNLGTGNAITFISVAYSLGAGIAVASPFFLLWAISRGKWIGFGDIEIMAITGFLLGILGGFSAVFFGFWIACIVVIPWYFGKKLLGKKMHHEIPMGPFLFAGLFIVLLTHWTIFDLLQMVIY